MIEIATSMSDGDEEHHQCCWLVRRHHQAAPVKVGLKQRERESRRRKEKVYVCGIQNKQERKEICTENEKNKKEKLE